MDEHIERMKAISEIKSYEFSHCPEYMQDWATKLKRAILDDIVDGIMDIPAADVAPVRHGRWLKSGKEVCGDHQYFCSECNEEYWEGLTWPDRAHYCPNCGAKMDLEA